MQVFGFSRRIARAKAVARGKCRPVGGFTLIEVLVVVAIIALLISILLPSLARAREQARTSVCLSNEKQIGLAMSMFSSEHRGRVPRGISRHGSPDPTGPVNWVRMVARMFGDRNNYSANFNRVPVEKLEVFSCPQRSREYGGYFLDYVVNSTDSRGPMDLNPCRPNPSSGMWYEVEGVSKIDKWLLPAETIYVTDAVEESWNIVDPNNDFDTLRGIREHIDAIRKPAPPTQTGFDWFDIPGGKTTPAYREHISDLPASHMPRASLKMHRSGSSAVFVDGHADLVRPPKASVGSMRVHQFYMRRLGVDRKIIPAVRVYEVTATLDPCAAGDTEWRP